MSQPQPILNQSRPIADLVIEDMVNRKQLGIERYGIALQAHNGRDGLQDLYEELLDACVYIRQCIEERKKMDLTLKVQKLHLNAIAPSYAHVGDSGLDLYPIEDFTLEPGEFKAIGTGIALELPLGHEAQVRPRSGLALKHGVTVLNSPGTVDCAYRGEVKVILINHNKTSFSLKAGEKAIAQLVIAKVTTVNVEVVSDISDTTRGQNGFGSTDKLIKA